MLFLAGPVRLERYRCLTHPLWKLTDRICNLYGKFLLVLDGLLLKPTLPVARDAEPLRQDSRYNLQDGLDAGICLRKVCRTCVVAVR